MKQVQIGPDAFDVIDVGDGRPVVFLHGALTDLRMWQPHCTMLSDRFRCVAVTQRYHGRRPWRDNGPAYGVATHATDLSRLVDALDLGPAAVVAWSYAGHVALEAATRQPDRFSGLVLFEPGVRTLPLDEEDAQAAGQDAQAMFGPIFEAAARGDARGAARILIDGSGGGGYWDALGPERLAHYLDNAHTLPLLLAQEAPPAATREGLAGLPMPVHVLWGQCSRPASKLPAQAVARCLPAGLRREVPSVGHLWPEEQPDAFCRVVAELIEK